jgi:hypothetical protein
MFSKAQQSQHINRPATRAAPFRPSLIRDQLMPQPIDALREAAATLLPAAPPNAVLGALRALIDNWTPDQATDRPPVAATRPLQRRQPVNGAESAPAPAAATALLDDPRRESWETLRLRVREERQSRRLTVAQLAEAIGSSATTLSSALGMRRPPTQRLQERLEAWLTGASEVVPAEPTFRNGAGAGHGAAAAGKGADTGADHAAA